MLTNKEIETVLTHNMTDLTESMVQQLIANARNVLKLDEDRVRSDLVKRFVFVPREFEPT